MRQFVEPPATVAMALAHARVYLLGRQSPQGGFCSYRSELLDEPNPFDTWHAVAALGLLGAPVPDAATCAHFVATRPVDRQPHALYYRVRSLQALASPDPKAVAVRAAVADLVEHLPDPAAPPSQLGGVLEALRHAVWLKRHFRCKLREGEIVGALLRLQDGGGGFPVPPDLVTTHAVCAVLQACAHEIPARTADYVQSLAAPGFGFRLTVNSLSLNLETVCAGIQCCAWSLRAVAYAADAVRFILACQGRRGGFARAPDALPGIAHTHLAVEALHLLCGPVAGAPS